MGTGYFPGVKLLGHGVDHPPPSSAEVKERVELNLYSPYGLSLPLLGIIVSSFFFLSVVDFLSSVLTYICLACFV